MRDGAEVACRSHKSKVVVFNSHSRFKVLLKLQRPGQTVSRHPHKVEIVGSTPTVRNQYA